MIRKITNDKMEDILSWEHWQILSKQCLILQIIACKIWLLNGTRIYRLFVVLFTWVAEGENTSTIHSALSVLTPREKVGRGTKILQ